MDSLTHIALGACIGESFFEKGFGKKAMLWGALAQSIPDIDFIASFWMNTPEALLAHRGFTHSILFAFLMVPVFALTADRVHKPHNIKFIKWIIFFSIEIFLHLFIDLYNSYGIGLLEPFTHTRFSINAIYVADPFFSVFPGIAFFMLLFLHSHHIKRAFWWKVGLYMPFLYISYCSINKFIIHNETAHILNSQHIVYKRYFTTPAPLQNWLWYIVAESADGYYVGYHSLFDKKKHISLAYFPRKEVLLKSISNHEELHKLIRFSNNYYTIEVWNDTLVLNDLRFGQIIGWQNNRENFVFHYYLQHPNDNKLVVQRGRFEKWDWQVFKNLVIRIMGN